MPFDPSALLKDFDGDQLGAVVDTMVLAADADGDISEEERTQMIASLRSLAKGTPHEAALTADRVASLLDGARQEIATVGREGLIRAVKQRLGDPDACRAALGLAIAVTAADGIVRTSERELIMELADALAVDQDEAADMVRDITRR